jgi:hypothetical protein
VIVILSILISVLSINYFVNIQFADIISYVFLLYYILIAILIYIYFSGIEFIESFYHILKLILYFTLFSVFAQFILRAFFFKLEIDKMSYLTFFPLFMYSIQPIHLLGYDFYRTCLFFWEPGILQIYLNLLFFLASFKFLERKIQLLSAIAIIFTFSTTGYIILFVQLIVFFKKELFKSPLISFFGLLLFFLMIPIFINNIKEKFLGKDQFSFIVRYYDTEMSINNTLNYPLKGIGLQNESTYSQFRSSKKFLNLINIEITPDMKSQILDREGGGSSNSLLKVSESFGLIIFLIFLVLLYKNAIFDFKKKLIFLILIISISTEPLLLTPFFMYIFISGCIATKISLQNE